MLQILQVAIVKMLPIYDVCMRISVYSVTLFSELSLHLTTIAVTLLVILLAGFMLENLARKCIYLIYIYWREKSVLPTGGNSNQESLPLMLVELLGMTSYS